MLRLGDIVKMHWCKAVVFGRMAMDYRCTGLMARLMECGPQKRTFGLSVHGRGVVVVDNDIGVAAMAWSCLADEMAGFERRAKLDRTQSNWRRLRERYQRRAQRLRRLCVEPPAGGSE